MKDTVNYAVYDPEIFTKCSNIFKNKIYYSGTNNHRLYTAALKSGKKVEIVVKGI